MEPSFDCVLFRRRVAVGKQLLKERAGLTPNQQVSTVVFPLSNHVLAHVCCKVFIAWAVVAMVVFVLNALQDCSSFLLL